MSGSGARVADCSYNLGKLTSFFENVATKLEKVTTELEKRGNNFRKEKY